MDVRIQAAQLFIDGGAIGKDGHLLHHAGGIDLRRAQLRDTLCQALAIILHHARRARQDALAKRLQKL